MKYLQGGFKNKNKVKNPKIEKSSEVLDSELLNLIPPNFDIAKIHAEADRVK